MPVTATAVAPPPPIARPVVLPATAASIVVAELREPRAASDVAPTALSRPAPTPRIETSVSAPHAMAPAARSVAAPTPTPRREFWVQVGAFRTADAATRLVERLRRHAVTIITGGDRLAPVMRVLVGPFGERAAAAAAMHSLQASGIAAFISDTSE